MESPNQVATLRLTHAELDLLLTALDELERSIEIPIHLQGMAETIRDHIRQARQRSSNAPVDPRD